MEIIPILRNFPPRFRPAFFCLLGSIFMVANTAQADEISRTSTFNDYYAEGLWLNKTDTFTGLAHFRLGARLDSKIEAYLGLRAGSDSRTLLERSDAIYNDNYLFPHIGVDWLAVPDLRLFSQIGYSFDLKKNIHLSGFDTRTGALFYSEKSMGSHLKNEIYGESIYVHRYRNLLTAIQFRFFSPLFSTINLGPLLTLAAQTDSAGKEYNRFLESRLGIRWMLTGQQWQLQLQPYWAYAYKFSHATGKRTRDELRFLLAVSGKF